MKFSILITVALSVLSGFVHSQENKYYSDIKKLSISQQELYNSARSQLNDWSGEHEKLESAQQLINRFIDVNPDFLPIYIEQARHTIMLGYTGTNNVRLFNLKALNIVKNLQAKAPNYSKSYVLAGHIYTNLKNYSDAERALRKAQELGSQDPWLYNNWAALLIEQRLYHEALQHSATALVTSGDNAKALLASIYNIEKIASQLNLKTNPINVVDLIFESFKTPKSRIRVSERLIDHFDGRHQILNYAYQIIARQKQETPDLLESDLLLAHLILTSGYINSNNQISRYDEKSSAAAEGILLPLANHPESRDRAFEMLTKIALNRGDYERAKELIDGAIESGVSMKRILHQKASLSYALGEYQSTIKIYSQLSKIDPSHDNDMLLVSAYEMLGDIELLEDYHLRQIERSPDNAWVQGNYAAFLLFNKRNSTLAIEHGEKALELMVYPMIQSVTGLAHQIKAAQNLENGDKQKSHLHYERSLAIGVQDSYVYQNCMNYCTQIREAKREYERGRQPTI